MSAEFCKEFVRVIGGEVPLHCSRLEGHQGEHFTWAKYPERTILKWGGDADGVRWRELLAWREAHPNLDLDSLGGVLRVIDELKAKSFE